MANVTDTHTSGSPEESIGELVKQLSEQTGRLARQAILGTVAAVLIARRRRRS